MFTKPFSFDGRIRRLEYGLSYLIATAALVIINIFALGPDGGASFLLILYIPIYWFIFAQGAKRCHDRNNSGWWQLIPFYVFWMIFADGDIGMNGYGPNPKGIGNFDEIDELGSHLQNP